MKLIFIMISLIFMSSCYDVNKVNNMPNYLIELDNKRSDYNFYILYQGIPFPKEELHSYFSLEKLDFAVECKTYKEGDNFLMEVPNKLEYYLVFGLVADIVESQKGQMNCFLIAKHKNNVKLSYYILYNYYKTIDGNNQFYLGVLDAGSNFKTNVIGLVGSSLENSTIVLPTKLETKTIDEYNDSLGYSYIYKNYNKDKPLFITTIPRFIN